jgi:hypothetical protein
MIPSPSSSTRTACSSAENPPAPGPTLVGDHVVLGVAADPFVVLDQPAGATRLLAGGRWTRRVHLSSGCLGRVGEHGESDRME